MIKKTGTFSLSIIMVAIFILSILLSGLLLGCSGGGGGSPFKIEDDGSNNTVQPSGNATGGERNVVCKAGTVSGQSPEEVQAPEFLMNIRSGETSWFASPILADLDQDGQNELIAAYYSVFVYDQDGNLLSKAEGGSGRIYAPHIVVDLEGDGTAEVVYGNSHEVYAYEWKGGALQLKSGWPADTTSGGQSPEIRGLAAADLDGNGTIEIIATTTQTTSTKNGGAQVFVFASNGSAYQPSQISFQAWPRYNNNSGQGQDADRNGAGHSGYGCYGLNVGIGNIDNDTELEILATYDNHHIQAFNHDGVAIDAAPYFTNRHSDYRDMPLTWGQFIRWADPDVEKDHYHLHQGEWPHPDDQEWLQWTASPPGVADLNQDGKNEVIGVPNIEMHTPYETQAYGVMVLEGAYGDGSRSGMRLDGWETLPRGQRPISVDGWYPPGGVPAAAIVNIQSGDAPEIVVSLNDGYMYAFKADASPLWCYDYTNGKKIMYATEPVVADLNGDGSPEIIFATYGDPDDSSAGHLFLLGADGSELHDIPLPNPGHNGNGNGAPAAPTIGDLDGDGDLEIFVQTFEHGMDVFTIPGSGCDCILWDTARGGPLRWGQPTVHQLALEK